MMLNYRIIAANLLWIIGSAILLAVWSIAYYRSRLDNLTVIEYLKQPVVSSVILAGLFLLFSGFAAINSRALLRVIWFALALAAAIFLILRKRLSDWSFL